MLWKSIQGEKTMMNAREYEASLKKLDMQVYMFGRKLNNAVSHPIIRPSFNAVAMTYELAHNPEYKELMTAKSHITGKIINRFTHIHQNNDDLIKKSKMGRLLGGKTGCCFQRCVGMDALNALSITTHEIDKKYGTGYYKRFTDYLEYVQEKDLVCDGAMTDPKGDRSLPPNRQEDPDMYMRVVREESDGIIVRGAKVHQTGALNSHEIIVMPTITMREDDKDYAVSFALPSDTKGIIYIVGRQSCDTRKLEEYSMDRGNLIFGGHEAVCVFEDVFVPWERVFMYREYEFTTQLVENFSAYHRQSYACKVGVGDVLIGAAQTIAEYNGVAKASHIRDKIVEMNHLNETLYCGCIACAAEGHREQSGTYCVDVLLANVHKQNITRFPYEIARIAQDIAGGLMVTLPSAADYRSPEIGDYLKKYFSAAGGIPTEHRMRILRLIENLTMGSAAVGYLTESMHGAGSPQAQRIMIARQVDVLAKQREAKRLCGIKEERQEDVT